MKFGLTTGIQVRIQDFKLGEAQQQKIVPSGARCEMFLSISCEKSQFYAKKIIFFPILGGGVRRVHSPGSAPGISRKKNKDIIRG